MTEHFKIISAQIEDLTQQLQRMAEQLDTRRCFLDVLANQDGRRSVTRSPVPTLSALH